MNLREYDAERAAGKWDMPILKATDHIPEDLISFNYMLTSKDYGKGIHFYIDDYQFERVWTTPDKYIDKLGMFDSYMNSLKDKAKKAQKQKETNTLSSALKNAMSSGKLEVTVNGKTYYRTRKNSATWRVR